MSLYWSIPSIESCHRAVGLRWDPLIILMYQENVIVGTSWGSTYWLDGERRGVRQLIHNKLESKFYFYQDHSFNSLTFNYDWNCKGFWVPHISMPTQNPVGDTIGYTILTVRPLALSNKSHGSASEQKSLSWRPQSQWRESIKCHQSFCQAPGHCSQARSSSW